MSTKTLQASKVGKTHSSQLQSPNSRKYAVVRTREYLLEKEIEVMRDALKKAGACHAHRDSTLILLTYYNPINLLSQTGSNRSSCTAMGANRLEWWQSPR
jgi:hypothetical protein